MRFVPLQPCPNTLDEHEKKGKQGWLGWTGALLVVLGYYLNANHYASSWLFWIVGNAMVGLYSIHKGAYSTAVMSFVILIMNIYGYFKWL